MNKINYPSILLFSQVPEMDELAIKILRENLTHITVTQSTDSLVQQLNTPGAKVILISCEQTEKSVQIYDSILQRVGSRQLLNHKVIYLVHKHEEECAHNAYMDGLCDDFLVSKPLYEIHRLVSMVRHLKLELGMVEYSTFHNYKINPKYSGINKKKQASDKYVDTISKATLEVEKTISAVASGSFTSDSLRVNFENLTSIIQKYNSDEQKSVQTALIEKLLQLCQTFAENTEQSSISTQQVPTLKERQLLLVEDDLWCAKLVEKILKDSCFKLTIASDGRTALRRFSEQAFDLIMMDIGLPDTDGAMLVSQLRNNRGLNQTVPVCMLTGAKDQETIKRCAVHNIQGYLVKPVSKDSLLTKLEQIFEAVE